MLARINTSTASNTLCRVYIYTLDSVLLNSYTGTFAIAGSNAFIAPNTFVIGITNSMYLLAPITYTHIYNRCYYCIIYRFAQIAIRNYTF